MPEAGEVKKWLIRVSGGVATTLVIFGLVASRSHFARSEETEERSLENEQRNVEQDAELAPIRELVEVLGKRMAAEDAGAEQDKMRCLQCIIKDRDICGAVGVEVCE